MSYKRGMDDLKMGSPSMAGDLIAQLDKDTALIQQLREQLAGEQRRANDSIEENVRLMNRLAAEREKVEPAGKTFKRDAEILLLREQIAAEREVGHNQAVALGQQIARLEDQLAAERDAHYGYVQLAEQHIAESKAELAAAVEALKQLQGLDLLPYGRKLIDATLAKIGGK
jgi:hypothetical protein